MPCAAQALPFFEESAIFVSGQGGYHTYRIPAITRTADGTLLAFAEGRKNSVSDTGNIDLVMRRSTDGGTTWGPLIVVRDDGNNTCGNPSPVVDSETGTIWLLTTWNLGSDTETMIVNGTSANTRRVFVQKSEDDGLTWSTAVEITSSTKLAGWTWYATGPGAGIQLQRGAQAGRLVVSCVHIRQDNKGFGSHVIYSDDHGLTWQIGAIAAQTSTVRSNENLVQELVATAPGGGSRLYFNARDHQGPYHRAVTYSLDGGSSYSPADFVDAPTFVTPMVQGGLTRFFGTDLGDPVNRLLFSCPNTPGSASYSASDRTSISIWSSFDESQTWSSPRLVYAGPSAYSDMIRIDTDLMGMLYERGVSSPYETITFARFNSAWLDVGPPPAENPSAAFWTLDERAVGLTASTSANAILDVHPANNKLHLTASLAFPVVASAPGYGGGRALDFNANGGLSITDAASANAFDYRATDSFTIEIVCRVPNGSTQVGGLVAKDVGPLSPAWWLRVENGKARFLVSDTASEPNVSSSVNINDGAWHHIAAVRDASNPSNKRLKIYVDGQLAGDVADTTTQSLANSTSVWVGSFNNGARRFTGAIDFVRITPGVLTPSQFAGAHTQLDADADLIPDAYERERAGSLSVLGAGTGDADGNGVLDYVEYALGSDPLNAGLMPVMQVQPGSAAIALVYQQRELPSWLSVELEHSLDLVEWGPAAGTSAQILLGDGIWQRTHTVPYPGGVPARAFFRKRVVAGP